MRRAWPRRWSWSQLHGRGAPARASSPAVRSSAWRSRGRWSTGRRCCCSTSRSARSTSSSESRCRWSSRASSARWASRSCTSPMTRRRRSRCRTASRSWTSGLVQQCGVPGGGVRAPRRAVRGRLHRRLEPAARRLRERRRCGSPGGALRRRRCRRLHGGHRGAALGAPGEDLGRQRSRRAWSRSRARSSSASTWARRTQMIVELPPGVRLVALEQNIARGRSTTAGRSATACGWAGAPSTRWSCVRGAVVTPTG